MSFVRSGIKDIRLEMNFDFVKKFSGGIAFSHRRWCWRRHKRIFM